MSETNTSTGSLHRLTSPLAEYGVLTQQISEAHGNRDAVGLLGLISHVRLASQQLDSLNMDESNQRRKELVRSAISTKSQYLTGLLAMVGSGIATILIDPQSTDPHMSTEHPFDSDAVKPIVGMLQLETGKKQDQLDHFKAGYSFKGPEQDRDAFSLLDNQSVYALASLTIELSQANQPQTISLELTDLANANHVLADVG